MNSPPTGLWIVVLLGCCIGCAVPTGSGADGSGAAATASGTLQITGSSTIAPLISEIGKRFERRHPGVRVEVQMGGSSRGAADARRGLADIGMVSRALNEEEADLHAFAIAADGVCVIVHADNPVASLSDRQIAAIYRGEIDNWKQVGGSDHAITVVNKAEGRSTLEIFAEYFGLESSQIHADVIIGDNRQGIKTVAGDPNAIGYVSIGTAQWDRDHGAPIRLLPAGGVEARVQHVASGRYPISRTLNLVTRTQPSGIAKQLIDFAQSPEVHDLIEELSFVPLPR